MTIFHSLRSLIFVLMLKVLLSYQEKYRKHVLVSILLNNIHCLNTNHMHYYTINLDE